MLVKQHNQHRRTGYWKAFRRAHKIVGRIVTAARSPHTAASAAVLAGLTQAADQLVHLSRGVARPVTGAGFATLHAVLLAGIATYVSDVHRLRDAVRDTTS